MGRCDDSCVKSLTAPLSSALQPRFMRT